MYFRAFEDSDVDCIYRWMNDDSLKNLSVGLNRRISREEALIWVTTRKNHMPYEVWWAICSVENNEIIGYASLNNIHYINSVAETGSIVIGDRNYGDGMVWIETVLFMFEYAFDRLNLNRLYGVSLVGHKMSNLMGDLMFMAKEGVLRQAVYKNGRYYDLLYSGILRSEYYLHKEQGDYQIKEIIRRLRKLRHG